MSSGLEGNTLEIKEFREQRKIKYVKEELLFDICCMKCGKCVKKAIIIFVEHSLLQV